MKIIYLDCFSGISGNMVIGALADAGLDTKEWSRRMAQLSVFKNNNKLPVKFTPVIKQGIKATHFEVLLKEGHPHRGLADITRIISASKLSAMVKERSINVFTALAKAESKVHGTGINRVHFHEVGAIDAIVDIVGAVLALEMLGIETMICSPIPLGSGSVKTSHGILPVPAPATALLLKGVPVYQNGAAFEITTPTGAVIASTLASGFGNMPQMTVDSIGHGAGTLDLEKPNILRVFVGDCDSKTTETISVIETNIDDMNPQFFDYVFEKLFDAGALDVYVENIVMKKNRPAFKLTALCDNKDVNVVTQVILAETTSLGVRIHETNRITLKRLYENVNTKYGTIKVKKAFLPDGSQKYMPEYEECKRAAKKFKVPLGNIYKEINRSYAKS